MQLEGNLEQIDLPTAEPIVLNGKFFSTVLGVEKKYKIYLPPNYYKTEEQYPVLYLFRGHEDEWFNPYQDHSRGGRAVQHLANDMIRNGDIGNLIIVGVSMSSDDGHVFGLGINFLNPELRKNHTGVGTGRFEDYLIEDVIPHIDKTYRTKIGREHRGADGFSLGGYLSVMMAVKHPELFCSVGSYDGSHMFRNADDPRHDDGEPDDRLWYRKDDMFAAAFRKPKQKKYDLQHLLTYNPLNMLDKYDEATKKRVRAIRFYITSAAYDDSQGNRDRTIHLATLFQLHGIYNNVASLILSTDAHHTWKFADLHLRETLKKHSEAFGLKREKQNGNRDPKPAFLPNIEIISVMDATGYNQPVNIQFRVYREVEMHLEILNFQGNHILTLFDDTPECGRHELQWFGHNTQGNRVASGIYYVQIATNQGVTRQKFMFLR